MNCKPGDLAYVWKTRHNSKGNLLGRVVKVMESAGELTHPDGTALGHCWWLEIQGTGCITRAGEIHKRGIYPDDCLRPIRPGEEPEAITRELETT